MERAADAAPPVQRQVAGVLWPLVFVPRRTPYAPLLLILFFHPLNRCSSPLCQILYGNELIVKAAPAGRFPPFGLPALALFKATNEPLGGGDSSLFFEKRRTQKEPTLIR